MKTFNLTEVIAESCDGVEFSEDRQFMEVTFHYYGDAIEYAGEEGEWEEESDFITQDFILRQDIYPQDYDTQWCYRACGYEVYDWYRFKLPPNRKAGTRYTVEEICSWIVDDEMSLNPKGYEYYNCEEE